jgi:hypothetical protein
MGGWDKGWAFLRRGEDAYSKSGGKSPLDITASRSRFFIFSFVRWFGS